MSQALQRELRKTPHQILVDNFENAIREQVDAEFTARSTNDGSDRRFANECQAKVDRIRVLVLAAMM